MAAKSMTKVIGELTMVANKALVDALSSEGYDDLGRDAKYYINMMALVRALAIAVSGPRLFGAIDQATYEKALAKVHHELDRLANTALQQHAGKFKHDDKKDTPGHLH